MFNVVAALQKDGFALVEDILNLEEHGVLLSGCHSLAAMQGARESIDANFQAQHKSTSHTFVNKHNRVSQLEAFASLHKIARMVNAIFDGSALFHMSLLQHNEAGKGQRLAWHRDAAFQFGVMQLVNLLFYPLGTDREKGGIRVLPGSHLTSEAGIVDSFACVSGEQTVYPGKRDLLLVDGLCFHAVDANESGEDRIAFNLRYRHAQAPEEITRYGEYPTGTVDYLSDSRPD